LPALYEHAYHIDHGAKAATCVDTFMDAIRWAMPTGSAHRWLAKS
jgi:superoxide dismutase, Fe-Mn family